jgi:antitoxin component YwqK of YwqJK toxin-antitoxin module
LQNEVRFIYASLLKEVPMKRIIPTLAIAVLATSCQTSNSTDQVVSQVFVHKYGFETSEKEWQAREQDGLVVSMLKSGVKVTTSYDDGKLHGPTTYTFPHSSVIEKIAVYDQGTLLKETINDPSGMPIQEDLYEFDNRVVTTLWDEKGVPLSIEEYTGDLLTEGKYYTPEHELEATVTAGCGERVKRERSGLLVSRDGINEGTIISRTTYHPNGNLHTVSHYSGQVLHGQQTKYTASGKPLMELNWNHGVLDGSKIIYRNGSVVAVIPYVNGQKHGIELHYDDLANLTAEIEWRNDQKHGTARLFSEEETETEWFFNGQSVSADKYKLLENRELIISEFKDRQVR